VFKNLENIVKWARGRNSLITYAELNDELHESIESQEEIENVVLYLIDNNISLFESIPSYIEQENILKNKIGKAFEDIELEDIKDKDHLDSIARYFRAYDNRTWDFAICSNIKQQERLDELGGMLSDIYACLNK
jgi:hypothetical protein